MPQKWIATLLPLLAKGSPEVAKRILRECSASHYDHLKMQATVDRFRGKLDDFLAFLRKEWGWVIERDRDRGVILVNENKSACVCPLVQKEHGPDLGMLCYCSEGFAEKMFSGVVGSKVRAEVTESVLRGHKSCKLARGLLGSGRARTGPFFAMIDVTQRCNLNCVGCRFHSPYTRRPSAGDPEIPDVSVELVERFCGELGIMGTESLIFSGAGEPMLHPRIFDLIGLAKAAGLKVSLLTNGTLLDRSRIESLIDSRLDLLKVSLWGGSPETMNLNNPGTTLGIRKSRGGIEARLAPEKGAEHSNPAGRAASSDQQKQLPTGGGTRLAGARDGMRRFHVCALLHLRVRTILIVAIQG